VLVLSFSVEGAGNCVEIDGYPYVYARTALGSFVLPARCAHRGGPLHLAGLDAEHALLICPWHERATPLRKILRTGIPAVRNGTTVTAVFPLPGDEARLVTHRPLSPDLSAPAAGHA
jgi:nitrite reductase/ring-hydroxylating ferredoxin subunit